MFRSSVSVFSLARSYFLFNRRNSRSSGALTLFFFTSRQKSINFSTRVRLSLQSVVLFFVLRQRLVTLVKVVDSISASTLSLWTYTKNKIRKKCGVERSEWCSWRAELGKGVRSIQPLTHRAAPICDTLERPGGFWWCFWGDTVNNALLMAVIPSFFFFFSVSSSLESFVRWLESTDLIGSIFNVCVCVT